MHDTCVLGWDIRLDKVVITFRVTVHTIPESQAGGSPRLVLRVPRRWGGGAQAGDIRLNRLERIDNYRKDREL